LGRDVTEAAFRPQSLADFRITHIAAQGIVSTGSPHRSALVVGADLESGEDGLLQVSEIKNLPLMPTL